MFGLKKMAKYAKNYQILPNIWWILEKNKYL